MEKPFEIGRSEVSLNLLARPGGLSLLIVQVEFCLQDRRLAKAAFSSWLGGGPIPITPVQLGASLAGNESSLATSTQSLSGHDIDGSRLG
jgi:hypothetical protein